MKPYMWDQLQTTKEKIKRILKKSKVKIVISNVVTNSKTIIWELKVKK